MTWRKIAAEEALDGKDLLKGSVDGFEILVIKDKGKYYATSIYCTHEGFDLSLGYLDNGDLVCSNHFATFNPADGSVKSPPEGGGNISPLVSYKTKVENGEIMVDL